MNTLTKKITTAIGLTLSLGFVSCEKDNLLAPNPAGSARSGAVNDDIVAGIPQVHKLIKHGAATLTYADNGRLLKVITPVRGGVPVQTDYTYSPGKIRAFSHQEKSIVRDETFSIDAAGRCYESAEKYTVINNNTAAHHLREWAYTYTDKGQLKSCQNKNSCVGGSGYSYNADGDMTHASVSTGVDINMVFAYAQPNGAPLINDEHPINVNVPRISEHDMYLRIFGRPSKHLLKRVSYESPGSSFPAPSDRFYTYGLDADGYVTQRSMSHTVGGNSLETTAYDYIITDITLSF